MKRFVLPAAIVALGFSGGGFALADAQTQASAPKPRACFYVRGVNSFREAGDQTVYLRSGVRDIYRLDLMHRCPDLKWALGIGLDTHGSWVCDPLDVTVIAGSSIGPQRCPVKAVSKLTRDEAAALPRKHRP